MIPQMSPIVWDLYGYVMLFLYLYTINLIGMSCWSNHVELGSLSHEEPSFKW